VIVVQEPLFRLSDGRVVPGRPVLLDTLAVGWHTIQEKLGLTGQEKQTVLEVGGSDWGEGVGVLEFYRRLHYENPLVWTPGDGWGRKQGCFDETG
jgi:hypothetical protein